MIDHPTFASAEAIGLRDAAAVDRALARSFERIVRLHRQLGLSLVLYDAEIVELPAVTIALPSDSPNTTLGERIAGLRFTDDALVVDLADGRTISTPLAWYPRLLHATPAQRARWEPAGGGFGVRWPELDEDLSVRGMLRGVPAAPGTWPASETTPA